MLAICYEIVEHDFYDKILYLKEHRQHIILHVHPNHRLLEPSRSKIQLILDMLIICTTAKMKLSCSTQIFC